MSMDDSVIGTVMVLLACIAIILIPFVAVTLIAIGLCNEFHITGIYWYSFIIVFDLIVLGLISALSRIGR